MEPSLVDFSFVYELSDNDNQYIYTVISLFLDSIPEKVFEFEKLVMADGDYTLIADQAHFLKSSSSVIIIRDFLAHLTQIETLAREGKEKSRAEIRERMGYMLVNFRQAIPLLVAEKCMRQNAGQ